MGERYIFPGSPSRTVWDCFWILSQAPTVLCANQYWEVLLSSMTLSEGSLSGEPSVAGAESTWAVCSATVS